MRNLNPSGFEFLDPRALAKERAAGAKEQAERDAATQDDEASYAACALCGAAMPDPDFYGDQLCAACDHSGTPVRFPDQPDDRRIKPMVCKACHDPIVGPKSEYRGEGPLHPRCAQIAGMQDFVYDFLHATTHQHDIPEARYQF